MMGLEDLLATLPHAYADLEGALVPAAAHRGDGGTKGDALNKPAPARLEVIEHRHLLLRGLRWWADAVRDSDDARRVAASSIPWLCGYLAEHLEAMDPGDRDSMHNQLDTWYGDALGYRGAMDDRTDMLARMPAGATEQQVRVADAARILGCTVRTIQRRVPAGQRVGGMVKLGDAMDRCDRCDLYVGAGCACALSP